jgi:hypothetical protein
MARDVFDSLARPVDVTSRHAPPPKQGQITSQQAMAFGRGLNGYGRSMQLVDGTPACSYERGCDHNHGHDPFGAEFGDHASVHDWRDDGWTVQQIPTGVIDSLPTQCIYCAFIGTIESHVCGTVKYLRMPTAA